MSNSFDNIASLYKLSVVLSGYSSYTENYEYEPSTSIDNNISDIFDSEDSDEIDFEECIVSDYLNKLKIVCENSTSLLPCLLIVWLFRSLLIQVNNFIKFKAK